MLVLGLILVVFSFYGDWVVSYTVVNNTDQSLLVWFMEGDCSKEIGYRYDYSPAEKVLPTERLRHHDIRGRFEGGCIQVATTDRRVVLSQPYEYGAVVVVSEPLMTLFGPIPPAEQLPVEPFSLTSFLDEPPVTLAGLAMAAAGAIPLLAAAALVLGRFRYRSPRGR